MLPVHVPEHTCDSSPDGPLNELDDCIMCFRRFTNLCSKVVQLWCDRGTNFAGGERELRESTEQCSQHQIERE